MDAFGFRQDQDALTRVILLGGPAKFELEFATSNRAEIGGLGRVWTEDGLKPYSRARSIGPRNVGTMAGRGPPKHHVRVHTQSLICLFNIHAFKRKIGGEGEE